MGSIIKQNKTNSNNNVNKTPQKRWVEKETWLTVLVTQIPLQVFVVGMKECNICIWYSQSCLSLTCVMTNHVLLKHNLLPRSQIRLMWNLLILNLLSCARGMSSTSRYSLLRSSNWRSSLPLKKKKKEKKKRKRKEKRQMFSRFRFYTWEIFCSIQNVFRFCQLIWSFMMYFSVHFFLFILF